MDGTNRRGFLASAAALAAVGPAAAQARGRTLIRNVEVLVGDAAGTEHRGVDVLIDSGKVAAIGKALPAAGGRVVEGRGRILMPGMVCGHRHNWMYLGAGATYADFYAWQLKLMPSATAEDQALASYFGGLAAIHAGVTTIVDQAHAHQTPDRVMAAAEGHLKSGVGGWFNLQLGQASAIRPGQTLSRKEAFTQRQNRAQPRDWDSIAKLKAMFAGTNVAAGCATSPGCYGRDVRAIAAEEIGPARAAGLGLITVHTGVRAPGAPRGAFGHRNCGILDLDDAGLLTREMHFSHAVELDDAEIAAMARTGAKLCTTPFEDADTGPRSPRIAPSFARADLGGVAAGLGVDSTGAHTQDFFEIARNARSTLAADPVSFDALGRWDAAKMLSFTTERGAEAVGLGHDRGKVAPGYRADLVLLASDEPFFPQQGSLAHRVLNYATRAHVDSVWVGGTLRKSGGAMEGADIAALAARLRAAQRRVARDMATISFT
ncbi:amidohydrolase family protein [Phenylobacterium sp.]|jgi:cytosine/adenosine deaminase-related metal-dependent hydrolase|uniref:amidohydrolase family protein n=1 Tax=Phenylobacterium sp. TaxID=1871053 RepID=UPI0037847431